MIFSEKNLKAPVNVNNDAEMVELGIRAPKWNPIVFTQDDKASINRERRIHKRDVDNGWSGPIKVIPFHSKLIVYTTGLDKTTYSHKCGQSDIPRILATHAKAHEVLKYSWNGKTYSKTTLPSYTRK